MVQWVGIVTCEIFLWIQRNFCCGTLHGWTFFLWSLSTWWSLISPDIPTLQVVESPSLDYSHFVSLPLAIHPGLVDKLFNFQNCILGIGNSSADEIVDRDSSEDNSEGEESEQESRNVAVKLDVADGKEQVKVDITNIPIVSYPPKVTTSSSLSGKEKPATLMLKGLSSLSWPFVRLLWLLATHVKIHIFIHVCPETLRALSLLRGEVMLSFILNCENFTDFYTSGLGALLISPPPPFTFCFCFVDI